jgi:hypothetical protein
VKPAYINLLDMFLSWISATIALELPVKDALLISMRKNGAVKTLGLGIIQAFSQ